MQETNLVQLYFQFDAFHSSKNARPLHIFTVFPKISTEDVPYVARDAGVGATLEKIGKGVYDFRITSARSRRYGQGYLIDHEGFWNIFIRTIESPTVAANVAKLWLNRMYPAICRSFVKSLDLLSLLDELNKIENSKLELMGYVLRAHDSPETMKKWPMGKPYSRSEIERDIKEQNKLLEAINFVFRVEGTYFKARLENNGHFVFYEGGPSCFSDFQRLVLTRFVEIALDNHAFFSNRERRIVEGEAIISQIRLDPGKKLSKADLDGLGLYLNINYSAAILHSGNPWLLLNLIDRGDGSSFDIYGYPSEIQIIPFNKASPESLMKLFYNICELFPLTKIKEL